MDVIGLSWRLKMALILLPTLGYGYLLLGQPFPSTERVATGVSYREMLREAGRPLFLLFLVLMMLTAATELGPNQWIGNLLQNLVGIQGILLLVYTAGIMFVGRQFFAGPIVRKLSPLGVLIAGSALSALGLYVLSHASTAAMVFVAATLFGLGTTFFWPTMLGVVAERFPKGGALTLGLMGGAGMLFVGYVAVPVMGELQNRYTLQSLPPAVREQVMTEGRLDQSKLMALEEQSAMAAPVAEARRYSASMTYRRVALVPMLLTLAFAVLFFYFRSLGGYRAVRLGGRPDAGKLAQTTR
jgi:MFS family permease